MLGATGPGKPLGTESHARRIRDIATLPSSDEAGLLGGMSTRVSRRFILSGLTASAALPAYANAPLTSLRPQPRGDSGVPPPAPGATDLINAAGLGGAVGYLALNADTGDVIDAFNPKLRLPPASVAKAATAFYAISRLGPAHRFETQLLANGPVTGGRLEGDLILRGGGDPTLDTDALGDLVTALKDAGIHEVTGRLRVDASALPTLPYIDPDQPDHVGYNPALSGLNLNFNRVHFEWKRAKDGYDVTMQARARRFRPEVEVARMSIAERRFPVYTYDTDGDRDKWTVARGALGKEGARWLPVRHPADYTAEVFRTLARSHGIVLRPGPEATGAMGDPLASHQSAPLNEMLRNMLRYSTNLTAEAVGIAATQAHGLQPSSLIRSAREMNLWMNGPLGAHATGFVDHSGLGYGSRVSAADMVHLMMAARQSGQLPALLRDFKTENTAVKVAAKTGTLNFVSALSGYATAAGHPPIVFAIFTADMDRRDAIRIEERERPPGARGWSRRSRGLQKKLIDRWVSMARV